MPVARSLDHLDMILVKFRDSPHLEAFRQPGHLDDPCGYCLGMLDDVGATHEEASHIFEHTPRRIREQVRAAIVQGVDAGVPVKCVGVMTRDAEASVEVTGSEAIEGQERVLVTFKVPLRQREACAV